MRFYFKKYKNAVIQFNVKVLFTFPSLVAVSILEFFKPVFFNRYKDVFNIDTNSLTNILLLEDTSRLKNHLFPKRNNTK